MVSPIRFIILAGSLLAVTVTAGCGSTTVPMTEEQIKDHENQSAQGERKARREEKLKANKTPRDQ